MQMPTDHLASLGCRPIARDAYMTVVGQAIHEPGRPRPWRIEVKPDNDGAPLILEQKQPALDTGS